MCLVGTLTIGQTILLSSSSFFAIVRRFSQGLRVSWVTPGLNWRGSLWETMDFLQWTLNLQVRRNKFIKNWTQITTIAHNDNYFGEVLGCLYPCLTVIWNKGTRLVNTKPKKCRLMAVRPWHSRVQNRRFCKVCLLGQNVPMLCNCCFRAKSLLSHLSHSALFFLQGVLSLFLVSWVGHVLVMASFWVWQGFLFLVGGMSWFSCVGVSCFFCF